jgi:hypothetical protein
MADYNRGGGYKGKFDPGAKYLHGNVNQGSVTGHRPAKKQFQGAGYDKVRASEAGRLSQLRPNYATTFPDKVPPGIQRIMERNTDTRANQRKRRAGVIISLLSTSAVALGFLLLSGNITGNVIYNLQRSDANITGLILIFLGFLGLMFCTRRK